MQFCGLQKLTKITPSLLKTVKSCENQFLEKFEGVFSSPRLQNSHRALQPRAAPHHQPLLNLANTVLEFSA
jgi:hypothetical protein